MTASHKVELQEISELADELQIDLHRFLLASSEAVVLPELGPAVGKLHHLQY